MRPTQQAELPVVGCLPYQTGHPGFALPILAAGSGAAHIQEVDEYLGIVSHFRPLEGDLSGVLPVPESTVARLRSPVVHAFIDEQGTVHVGELPQIADTLRRFVERRPDRAAVCLQIEELIGTDAARRSARVAMRDRLFNSTGEVSARAFYEGSVLRSVLWKRILSLAPTDEAAQRILRVRSQLKVAIEQDGKVRLELSALAPQDLEWVDIDTLTAELQSELAPVLSTDSGVRLDYILELPPHHEALTQALQRVRSAGRQEERIAIVLDEILKNRSVGKVLLTTYRTDRGKFASSALAQIRERFIGDRFDDRHDELLASELVDRFFREVFPMNRGEFLYQFSRHLSRYASVNAALSRCLNRTNSILVEPYRPHIQRNLTATNV